MDPSRLSTPASTLKPPESGKARLNRWTIAIVVIGILVVGVLFSLIYYSTAQVSTKTFSYSAPPDYQGSYKSLSISDVDGLVALFPWSQPSILINGTITTRGLGASLSNVAITNSTVDGEVVFKAMFAASGGILLSQTYSVSVSVYVPSSLRFSSVQVSNINGGVHLNSVNSTGVIVTTVNGNISVGCVYCVNATATSTNGNVTATLASLASQGSYNLTATNANVNFTAPASSSFRLSARVLNGSIICIHLNCTASNATSLVQVFGKGSANVNLDSVNGQITITGT